MKLLQEPLLPPLSIYNTHLVERRVGGEEELTGGNELRPHLV